MWPSVRDSSMVSSGVSGVSMSRAEDEGVLAIVVGVGENAVMEGVAFFSCSMILWSSLSLASFSYCLLRSSFSFSILLRFRFI